MSRVLSALATALAILALLAVYWALLFAGQRAIMFPAPPLAGAPVRPPDAQAVWLETASGRVEAWWLPPVGSWPGPAPLLLFTHGNGELIDHWPAAFDEPRSWGLGVLLLEYPGYGRSEGHPSERAIRDAIVAADHWARQQPGIDAARIVAYGRSLGGSAAAMLAADRGAAALILESAFTSAGAFARRYFAPGFLARDPLDTRAAVSRFEGPVLVLHGEHDVIVPVDHGRALAAASPKARLHVLSCGHNDCPRPWTEVRGFLDEHGLLPSTGERRVPLAIVDVSVIDVDAGLVRPHTTVVVDGDAIAAMGPAGEVAIPPQASHIAGEGRFLIPGLWDMHTHAHRDGRTAWHYSSYLAHGVTGIRDMGTYEEAARAARSSWRADADAPTVWWGSPPLDGVPPVLSFGVPIASAAEARTVVDQYVRAGARFLKVYDRLDPETYQALTARAREHGVPVEGHVPLRLSPADVVTAGQRTIEHLTLVLESCIPGTLDWIATDTSRDAMALLSDGRLAASLHRYDARACTELFARFREAGVWQVPTLVQMRGAFMVGDPAFATDPRLQSVPAAVRADWEAYRRETPRHVLEAGAAVFRRQHALVGAMYRAGVPILAGTDASDEPWVFPGASLHDELVLFVDAGLSPMDALRTATRNPARYRGESAPLLAPGRRADLVLLGSDPTRDIEAVRRVEAVILRGRRLDLGR